MTDFPQLLRLLADARVEHVVVGGAAAIAHGSARLTQDLDIVPKDFEATAELEAIREEKQQGG